MANMKTKRVLTFALGLVLLLASSACTRNEVGTPSPVGPSSFAVLLKLSASRNVIYAGDQRDGSTISVSLKQFDGTPLVGRTVYFEICDSAHLRVDVGYFEGMERVISRQTDSGGNITFVYNGPLNSEIDANTSVYIWASAASEGNEFIEDFAQVNIVRDSSSAGVLEISANPNVIFAGGGGEREREWSTISVSYKALDGTPLAGRTIFFEICDSTHVQVLDIGFFEGGGNVLSRKTDAGGNISLIYHGPLRKELKGSTSVYIYATVASEGDEFIEGFTQIKIISDR
jgi:hypothetical protein